MANPRGWRDSAVWPWVVGLLVLVLLIWGISELIETEDAEIAEVEVGAPEAAVPEGEVVPAEPVPGEPYAPQLIELFPLGPEDAGELVRVSGDVVGEPTDEGHWVLTDVDEVVFVRTDRGVASGQNVTSLGRLQPIPEGGAEAWIAEAGLREAAGWNVHRDLYIDAVELYRDEERGEEPGESGTPAGPRSEAPGASGGAGATAR